MLSGKERASTILVKVFFFFSHLFKGMVCFIIRYINLYRFLYL